MVSATYREHSYALLYPIVNTTLLLMCLEKKALIYCLIFSVTKKFIKLFPCWNMLFCSELILFPGPDHLSVTLEQTNSFFFK